MVYFEDLIEEAIKNPQPHEFSGLESTDEIVEKIRENTLNSLEEETSFMKEFPNPIYAFMRLDYLSESEDDPTYWAMISALKEVIIKEVVEA